MLLSGWTVVPTGPGQTWYPVVACSTPHPALIDTYLWFILLPPDREWYSTEEGYQDDHNPFTQVSEEFTKKKEQQLEVCMQKHLTPRQVQIKKDNEVWENNRLARSGVVQQLQVDDGFDEEAENRVNLLVYNIVPPFLDGRIVFTKHPEPVVHVRDPTSDMAVIARKGEWSKKCKRVPESDCTKIRYPCL